MYTGLHAKYRYSYQMFMKLELSPQIFENIPLSNLTKIRPVGAELFHAGGRTDRQKDMTKLIVAFHNFANEPKEPCNSPAVHSTRSLHTSLKASIVFRRNCMVSDPPKRPNMFTHAPVSYSKFTDLVIHMHQVLI
jgi:hypothetical protein